jgi:hypothetical protein
VDEFLYSTVFCNNYKDLFTRFPEIIKNGYYSSSLNTRYMSVIEALRKLNNDEYVFVSKGTQPWF